MNDQELIEVITPLESGPIKEVRRELTKQQFLEELVGRAAVYGEDQLEMWLKAHDISRAEALAMCDVADIPQLLALAQTVPSESQEKTLPEMQAFVNDAAAGDKVAQQKLSTLAWNAENMSDAQLERELRDAGLLQHRMKLGY